MKYALFLISTLMFGHGALAGSESQVAPCPGCPQFDRPPYPQAGHWFNAEHPGTGINLDVQNGVLAATYYGYSEDGRAVWYEFSGTLTASDLDDVYWELEVPLYEMAHGEVIGGDYHAPELETAGTIQVEFLQRGVLRMSVDGSSPRLMTPMQFGAPSHHPFASVSPARMPGFEGSNPSAALGPISSAPWLIVQYDATALSHPGFGGYSSYQVHWAAEGSGDESYGMVLGRFAGPSMVNSGLISCDRANELATRYPPLADHLSGEQPMCVARVYAGNAPDGVERIYFMPPGNLGDRRFSAVSPDGWVMEGFRLGYD